MGGQTMHKWLVFFLLFFSALPAQNLLLWNGETPNIDSCQFYYGSADSLHAYQGTYCFQGIPDPWHSPGINLQCQGSWRADLSGYDEIWFYARCNQTGKTFDFSIYGWPHTSRAVNIDPYIVGGGGLDTVYKLIRIPIDSLKTDDYHLQSVEILYFGEAQPTSGHKIYIDDIWAMDIQPTSVDTFTLFSQKVIRLSVNERYDTTAVKNLANYSLSSTTDPDYATARHPTQIGMHYYVTGFPDDVPSPTVAYELYLIFDAPLKNGHSYTLTIYNIRDAAGNDFTEPAIFHFTYNDLLYINGSVKTNQVGYLPVSPKYGYVGNYLGSAGMMEIAPGTFQIREAETHQVVFSGVPTFRSRDLRRSGEKVYECDFTALSAVGRFYLYVPGVGRSYDFEISPTVFDSVYYHTARALYYQRCGTGLSPPWADSRWSHGACHLEDAEIHSSQASSPLYNGEPIGAIVPMPGGWHDAGDYGKYVPTAAVTLFYLFTAYELFPEKFPDGFWNIPESGNGVPDILDEARWELNWLKEMQAPDGGVYFKVTTENYPTTMPELDNQTRYIAEKTTHTTALYAAVLAMAYRNLAPFWPDYADTCLARAVRAWHFLQMHPETQPPDGFHNPPGIGGGEYTDPEGDTDDRAWAAAELYKSTGDPQYDSAFAVYWPQHSPDWGWNEFQHHQKKASWAYATTTFPTQSAFVESYEAARQNAVENYLIVRSDTNAYRNAYRSDVLSWIGWGSFGQSTAYSWELIRDSYLLNQPGYLDYAKINLDVQLGNNPQYRSYITGIGYHAPRDPTHHPSLHDGVAEPVPGLPVFGPHSHMPLSNPYYYATQSPENLYPRGLNDADTYPTLRRWFDCHQNVPMNEFTIINIAEALASFAFFSSVQDAASPTNLQVPIKIFLQGAYRVIGDSMDTALNRAHLLPLFQPYSGNPWKYSGSESVAAIPSGVVDWVLVELRTSPDPLTRVATRAGFLRKDGQIVDLDGNSPVTFPELRPGNYYLVVRHRNHIPVMSAVPHPLTSTSSLYDFTDNANRAYSQDGTAAMAELAPGRYGMIAGDANGDGIIDLTDRNQFWEVENATSWEYHRTADFNLDEGIDAIDLNGYWLPNLGKQAGFPLH